MLIVVTRALSSSSSFYYFTYKRGKNAYIKLHILFTCLSAQLPSNLSQDNIYKGLDFHMTLY